MGVNNKLVIISTKGFCYTLDTSFSNEDYPMRQIRMMLRDMEEVLDIDETYEYEDLDRKSYTEFMEYMTPLRVHRLSIITKLFHCFNEDRSLYEVALDMFESEATPYKHWLIQEDKVEEELKIEQTKGREYTIQVQGEVHTVDWLTEI